MLQNFAQEAFYVGNPNLKPETTDSFEAGLFREWLSRARTHGSLLVPRIRFTDLILFDFSTYPASWKNVDQSWARGVELSGTVRLVGAISLRTGYTRLYTRDLQHRPIDRPTAAPAPNSGTISLELRARGAGPSSAGGRFVGERPDNNFLIPASSASRAYNYGFAGGSVPGRPRGTSQLFVRIDNALNGRYQEVLGYAALRRIAAGGVKLTW